MNQELDLATQSLQEWRSFRIDHSPMLIQGVRRAIPYSKADHRECREQVRYLYYVCDLLRNKGNKVISLEQNSGR